MYSAFRKSCSCSVLHFKVEQTETIRPTTILFATRAISFPNVNVVIDIPRKNDIPNVYDVYDGNSVFPGFPFWTLRSRRRANSLSMLVKNEKQHFRRTVYSVDWVELSAMQHVHVAFFRDFQFFANICNSFNFNLFNS